MISSLLFWNMLASCLLCVQMYVWEPLLIVNVTGNASMSPLDIWKEQTNPKRSENSTTEQWIVNVTETTPFVSERISTWDTIRPDMLEVQAVRYRDEEVHVLQSILFNTSTVASSSFNDWMREEYVSDPHRYTRVMESPYQDQSKWSMFRYNYESTITVNGVETLVKGGMALIVDTRDVSGRDSLLLTSHTRNIGAINEIVSNLHLHTYQSRIDADETDSLAVTQERISSHNHKIVRKIHRVGHHGELSKTFFEMADGVIVKNIRLATLQVDPISFMIYLGLKDGDTMERLVQDQWSFESNFDMEFLYIDIQPYGNSFITDLRINITYSYLPYDVADYFVIQGRFATCNEPPDIVNTVRDGTGTIVGSLWTYNCSSGTSLVSGSDPATSHCQSNGTWSLASITCEIPCGDPVDPANVAVISGTTINGRPYRTYKCAPGTSLISGTSPINIVCWDGVWPQASIECAVISTSATLNTTSVSTGSTSDMTTSSETSTPPSAFAPVSLGSVTLSDTTISSIATTSEPTSDQVLGDTTITDQSVSGLPETMATTISTNRPSLDRTASFPNTSVEQECLSSCPCKSVLWGNITSLEDLSPTKLAELNKKIKQLKSQLSVNKTALSTYKAKKISASDDRSSAAGIGTIGIAIIVIVVLMIAIADVTSFLPSKHRVHSTSCRARGMKQRMESRM